MAHSKVAEKHMTNKILDCPRDGSTMTEQHHGESILDVCGKCGGQFFDTGEMYGAFGKKADPSLWDRDEKALAQSAAASHDTAHHGERCARRPVPALLRRRRCAAGVGARSD